MPPQTVVDFHWHKDADPYYVLRDWWSQTFVQRVRISPLVIPIGDQLCRPSLT